MLKLLYKTLLISVLSCSLMVLDFNSKGLTLNNIQAESVTTQGVSDSDLMATLTMGAVGLLTSRLYMCTYLSTDMMIAAAGGAAFIAGEILSTIKLRKVMKDLETQITRDKKGNINKEQIESLERLKKSYEEAKKTAGTKKTLQQASAAAFLAAAAVAYSLDAAHKASEAACQASITAAGGSCSAEAAAYAAAYAYPKAALATAGGTSMLGSLATTVKGWLSQLSLAPSAVKEAEAKATDLANETTQQLAAAKCQSARTASVACKQTIIVKEGGKGVCMTPPGLVSVPSAFGTIKYAHYNTPVKHPKTFAEIFQTAFIANANADLFTPLGIASTAAVSYLMATSTTLGMKIDTYLYSPMNRAIIWAVLAGLAYAASSSTDNVIKKLESNIEKIDNIINNMNSMAAGATGTQLAQKQPAVQNTTRTNKRMEFNETDYGDIDLEKDGSGALPCFTGPKTGKDCKSFVDANKDLPSFQSLNLESQKQINGILTTANGFNGVSKISAGTLNGASSLAASANALKASVAAAKKKLSDALKASNSKINLEEREKSLALDLEKTMRDGLKKRNMTADQMVASMYGGRGALGSGSGSGSSLAGASDVDSDVKASATNSLMPAVGVVDISAPSATDANLGLTGLDEGTKELSAEELAKINESQKAAAGSTIDDYEIKNDITNDTSSSIFELISNRYQKSGYPRLFKIKEPSTPVPVKN